MSQYVIPHRLTQSRLLKSRVLLRTIQNCANSEVGYRRGLATKPVSSSAVVTLSGAFSEAVRSTGITTLAGTSSPLAAVNNTSQ